MVRYKEKGKAQIVIGGKDYGAVEIGNENMPAKAIDKISEALLQIQTGEQPHFNLVFGEGGIRRGITIVDGVVYAVEKSGSDMKTYRIDYTGLKLPEDAPVEEVVFKICVEILGEGLNDISRWAEELVGDDEEKQLDFIKDFFQRILDTRADLSAAMNYYRMPAHEKRVREKAFEVEMLRESIKAPLEMAINT